MLYGIGTNQNAETTKFNLPNIGELALYAVCAAGLLYTGLFGALMVSNIPGH